MFKGEDKFIRIQSKQQQIQTAQEICEEFNITVQKPVSFTIVQHPHSNYGLKACVVARKTLLSKPVVK